MIARVEAVHDDEAQGRRCSSCMPCRRVYGNDRERYICTAIMSVHDRWQMALAPVRASGGNLRASSVVKCSRAGIARASRTRGGEAVNVLMCGGIATPSGATLGHMNVLRAWVKLSQEAVCQWQVSTGMLEYVRTLASRKTTSRAARTWALRSRECLVQLD